MRISYEKLFSVECVHEYFADHVCKALTLRPTAECERMLQRYRLLFRPAVGGGAVYYSEPELLQLYREVTPFAFILTSTDPLLDVYTESNVTEVPSPSDTVHYFSNREEYPADNHLPLRQLLHPAEKPFATPPLQVRASVFTHPFEQPVRDAKLQVSDALFGKPVWGTQTPAQEVRNWTIDLRGQHCGRYQLSIDGKTVLDFYLSDTPAVRQWGVVEIFAGGPELATHIPTDRQVIDASGQLHSPTFVIELSARKTFWRYHIFYQSQQASVYKDHHVASPGDPSANEILFNRMEGTAMVNGREDVVFESQQAVALFQSPTEHDHLFTFEAKDRRGPTINLPYAQPAGTKLDATPEGRRMCSEILVYL